MIHEVYAIYNTKSKFYERPFNAKNSGDAERAFEQAVNDPQTFICRYPEDYALHLLGKFDDSNGRYEQLPSPEHKFNAMQLKNPITKEAIHAEFDKIYDLLKQYYGDNQQRKN